MHSTAEENDCIISAAHRSSTKAFVAIGMTHAVAT